MKEIGFNYGVLCDSLKQQANKQGYELNDYKKFERIREAINMCGFHVATESQVDIMFKKLNKQVTLNLFSIKTRDLTPEEEQLISESYNPDNFV